MHWKSYILVAALVGLVPFAQASEFRSFDRTAQVRGSDLVVRGRVVSLDSAWDETGSSIRTDVELSIDEVWKGTAEEGDRLIVRTLGGTVDNIMLKVDGAASFSAGEDLVLFLRRTGDVYTPWGMTFGKYQVVGSPADPFVIGSLPPAVAGGHGYEQVSLTLNDLRAEVRSALDGEAR